MTKKEKNDLNKICKQISNDHYELLKNTDSNMSYTFNLYANGSYQGQYKKFIFYAELRLNQVLGLITADEVENVFNMIMSSDEDNFYIAFQIIKHFLKERHTKFGAIMDYKGYDIAREKYTEEILNPADFLTKLFNT
jgi:uncharacterized Fe-S cluster-containing radical SAM superfamily protein